MSEKIVNEISEYLLQVDRVSRATKGGRRFSFRVIVIVGDGKGKVGCGVGRHAEVVEARKNAVRLAKARMFSFPLKDGRTIYHTINAKFCASRILMRPAPPGVGVIAGSSMRAFCDAAGIKDLVCKASGSTNPRNVVMAMINSLSNSSDFDYVQKKRQKKLFDSEVA